MSKLIRITTVPLSLDKLLAGQMRFFRTRGMEVSMASAGGDLVAKVVEREGCPHHVVDMTRSVTPIRDLVSLLQMIRLLRRLRPEIVHTETPKAGLIGMLAARWCEVPVRVHTIAGLPLMERRGLKRRMLVFTEKMTYWGATRVYPNSRGLREYVLEHRFLPPAKLFFIGDGTSNGVDTEYFTMTEALASSGAEIRIAHGIPEDSFVFIYVGRLVKDKGINELCAAFDRLSTRHPDIRLLLVGPFEEDLDPIGADARRIIEAHPGVITCGFQDDIRPYLAASDTLVLPSYREGFPNVPMQAGCMDLPCIVTDINGCNEIIEHEVNGLLVPAKDATSLELAMERMLNDRALRLSCSAKARGLAASRFSCERIWTLLWDAYAGFLKDSGVYKS